MRRGPASGRFLPRCTADAVPLLMHDARDPHAVALGSMGGRVTAERGRAKRIANMNKLRREVGLPEWRAG